jgi:hypothetical protein
MFQKYCKFGWICWTWELRAGQSSISNIQNYIDLILKLSTVVRQPNCGQLSVKQVKFQWDTETSVKFQWLSETSVHFQWKTRRFNLHSLKPHSTFSETRELSLVSLKVDHNWAGERPLKVLRLNLYSSECSIWLTVQHAVLMFSKFTQTCSTSGTSLWKVKHMVHSTL